MQKQAKKLKKALIFIYFGKFNNYFDLWLQSCKHNMSYTFFLFTDNKSIHNYPENVKVIYHTFNEIKKIINQPFDFKISLEKPYKLCDYKVAYGEIFSSYLIGYDYWGYCDVDLIFGNLDKLFPDSLITQYDKICSSGHFTLYKNIPEVTKYYRRRVDGCLYYKDVFSKPYNFCFDEHGEPIGGINAMFRKSNFNYLKKYLVFADILVDSYGLRNTRETYANEEMKKREKKKKKVIYSFEDGTLIQYSIIHNKIIKNEEAYIHLQKRSMINNVTNNNSFLIVPNNTFVDKHDITLSYLKKIKEYPRFYTITRLQNIPKLIKLFLNKVKRYLKSHLNKNNNCIGVN